jgi:hypothetical protein
VLNLLEFLATNPFRFAKLARLSERSFFFRDIMSLSLTGCKKLERKAKTEAGLSHFQDFPIAACPFFETTWCVVDSLLASYFLAED